MKAAYKWRLDGNHDLWLIDPKNTNTENYSPKIYDKTTTILTGEEQGVKNIVSSLSKDEYKLLFSQATSIANKEYPNLKFLDVDYYYNLKADGCLSRQAEMTINDVILKATGKVVQIDDGDPSVDIDYSKQTAYEKNLDFTFTLPRLSGDYLPLSGGTINGDLKVTAGNNENPVVISDSGIYPQVNGSRTIGRGNNYFDVGYVLKLYTDSVNVNDLTVKNKIDFRPNYTDPELSEMGFNIDANGFYPTKTERYNIGKKTNKFYEVCSKDVLCNNIIPDNYYSQNVTLIGKESAPFNEIHVAKVQMYETEEFREDEGLKPIKDGKIVCANGTTIDGIYYNTFDDTDQYPDKYETSTFSSLYDNLNNEIFENYGINVASIRTIDYLPLNKDKGGANAQFGINTKYPALFWRQIMDSRSNMDWTEYLNEHDESKTEGEDGYYLNRLYGKWISFAKIADKKYRIDFKDEGGSLYKERISGIQEWVKGLWLYDDNGKKYYGTINNVSTQESPIYHVSFESLPKECLEESKNITDYKIYFSPYTENGWLKWELAQAEPFCEYYSYDPYVGGNGDPWGRKYPDCIPTLSNGDQGHVKFSFMKISNKDVEGTDDKKELTHKYFVQTPTEEYWANTIIMREGPRIPEKVKNSNIFENKDNNNLSIFGVRSGDNTQEPRAFIGNGSNSSTEPTWNVRELVTDNWTGNVKISGKITSKTLKADSIEAKTEDSLGTVTADYVRADKIEGDIINSKDGFFETSDVRLKNIIGNVDLDIDKILNLSIIYFTLKNDKANKQQVGVIAQEIAEICPEIVFKDSDGYLSVDYAKMSLLCLYCIKDLYKKITK